MCCIIWIWNVFISLCICTFCHWRSTLPPARAHDFYNLLLLVEISLEFFLGLGLICSEYEDTGLSRQYHSVCWAVDRLFSMAEHFLFCHSVMMSSFVWRILSQRDFCRSGSSTSTCSCTVTVTLSGITVSTAPSRMVSSFLRWVSHVTCLSCGGRDTLHFCNSSSVKSGIIPTSLWLLSCSLFLCYQTADDVSDKPGFPRLLESPAMFL